MKFFIYYGTNRSIANLLTDPSQLLQVICTNHSMFQQLIKLQYAGYMRMCFNICIHFLRDLCICVMYIHTEV